MVVYREKNNKWIGPIIFVDSNERMITECRPNANMRKTFNAFQVKPYYHPYKENLSFMTSESQTDNSPLFRSNSTECSRAWKFDEAIRKDIASLLETKTWKVVLGSEVPEDANILKGIFILATKEEGTDNEIWKARSAVQGQCDAMIKSINDNISVAGQHTVKMLVGLAAIFSFRIFQVLSLKHTYRTLKS